MLWCGNTDRHSEDRVIRTGRHTFKEEARESVELRARWRLTGTISAAASRRSSINHQPEEQ